MGASGPGIRDARPGGGLQGMGRVLLTETWGFQGQAALRVPAVGLPEESRSDAEGWDLALNQVVSASVDLGPHFTQGVSGPSQLRNYVSWLFKF